MASLSKFAAASGSAVGTSAITSNFFTINPLVKKLERKYNTMKNKSNKTKIEGKKAIPPMPLPEAGRGQVESGTSKKS